MLTYIWSGLLQYPILSSALVHVMLTTVETFILQLVFFLFDFGYIKAQRLKVYERNPPTVGDYWDATKLVAKNSVLLWLGVAGLTFALSGDVHGHYSIQGISRDRFPLEAPTWFEFAWQSAVTIVLVDFSLYWMHRAFHYGILYRKFHSVHHGYHDTIALHSMCAHIVEIYSALFLLFLVPRAIYEVVGLHPLVVYITPFLMTLHGVLEHCGFDDRLETLTCKLFTGSKMHMVHHQLSKRNFGFYTYFWDYLFGTLTTYDEMASDIDAKNGIKSKCE